MDQSYLEGSKIVCMLINNKSKQANYLCFGLQPTWFHTTNVALHAIACILFTKVCLCVAGLKPPFATLGGLLFAAHPIHTEAIAPSLSKVKDFTRTNMHINQESRASRLSLSLLGEQTLPLGAKKLHWLPFWTLKAPLTGRESLVNGAGFAKTWSRANAHQGRRWQLSPLLLCLLVDDLLSDLRRAGFYAQCYTDDITIMVSGRFESVVFESMQVALRLVEI
ncbi:hypothetical protein Trydic_g18765 [Trypoxylus dichotomus]